MAASRPPVGVLGIQGDIEKHLAVLDQIGADGRRVLAPKHLEGLAALILPGGESTTISKGLVRHELVEPIVAFTEAGGSILGTCAGAILISREAKNHPVPTLGLVDVTAERNAYGTQLDSFVAEADIDSDPGFIGMECVFIRAPRLSKLGGEIDVLMRVEGEPVLVREGKRLACTFHPELTQDTRVHQALLETLEG